MHARNKAGHSARRFRSVVSCISKKNNQPENPTLKREPSMTSLLPTGKTTKSHRPIFPRTRALLNGTPSPYSGTPAHGH